MLSRANRIRMFFKGTPIMAFISFIIGLTSIVIFVIGAVISIKDLGNSGIILGVLGISAMLLNVIGFVMAVKSTKNDKDMYYGVPLVSVVMNGMMFIIYMIFYSFGFLVSL